MFNSHRTRRWRSNMSTSALKAVLCLLVVPVSGGFTPCGVKPLQLWTPATRQLGSIRGGAFTHKVGPLAFKRGGAEERAVLERTEGPLLKGDEKKLLVEKGGGEAGMTPLTVWSATALIAGTTVGAGILALPAFTVKSGFLPSTAALLGAWVYMATTGLLIAEVSINMAKDGHPSGGLIAMIREKMGSVGANLAGVVYLFLHWALLIAYIAQGGDILGDQLRRFPLFEYLPAALPPLLFTTVLGSALALGSKKVLDLVNDGAVIAVVLSFVALVALGAPKAHLDYLLAQDWTQVISAIPVMFVALVFHNVVPVVSYRLDGKASDIRQSVVVGSLIPLLMFISWNAVILGNVPPSLGSSSGIVDPVAVLMTGSAGDTVAGLTSFFSELAIITSFTGFVYGLKDFFKDTVFSASLEKNDTRQLTKSQDLLSYLMVLAPPATIAVLSPKIFYAALENAGTFGICVLFGLIPPTLAAISRRTTANNGLNYERLIPGGDPALLMVGAVAAAVIGQEVVKRLSLLLSQ